ncbi:MAG: glycosyltransferase [Actinomycetaceae bacterium]|nr:glycosyltransferase [Actinomycetaceae bacterium]
MFGSEGMGKRCLVMLTDTYPFAVGEEFIEQEINQVCAQFDKVVIIPVRVRQGQAQQTRTLPANAVARLLPPDRIRNWRVKTALYLPKILLRTPSLIANAPIFQPRRFLMDIRFAANVLALYRKTRKVVSRRLLSQFDSVVFYAYWMHTPAVLGCLMREGLLVESGRSAVVARAHAYDVDESYAPHHYIPGRRFLLDRLYQVYPISNYAARFLHAHGERHADQVEVRRLGVPSVPPVQRTNQGQWKLLSCSHMTPYKRIDLMLEAVAELQARGHSVHWTHVGEANQQRLDDMRQLARQRLQPGTFDFLGHVPNEQARSIYADPSFTLFLNTSLQEGVPVSIMEAQAASLPVVATNAGGTAEVVLDGENGSVVAVDSSAKQIADAIWTVLTLAEGDYRKLVAAAHAGWQERSNGPSQYRSFAAHLGKLSKALTTVPRGGGTWVPEVSGDDE